MTATNKNNWLIAISPIIFIFIVCSIIAIFFKINSNPFVLTGISIDLTITAPVLYFLLIRKSTIPNSTVLRVFIIGVLLAGLLLHNKNIPYLIVVKKWIVPIIELGTIGLIGYKFLNAKKQLKDENNFAIDFPQHCRNLLFKIIGNEKIANVLASEFTFIYYLFAVKKNYPIENANYFSYHKIGNTRLLLSTFIGLIAAETIGFHFLLTNWNTTLAWVFTVLSFYTCLQLMAHIKAMKHRPVLVYNRMLYLRNGLAGDVNIDIDNIADIELNNKNIAGNNVVKLCLLKGLEKHNMTIYLKQPVDVIRMFGIKKQADIVLLRVDNPKQLLAIIKNR